MIANLQANVPMFLVHFNGYGLLYIKQYGAGNLRLAPERERLLNTTAPLPIQDGIVQVTADGWKQYFWEGDLYVISDVAGALVWEAPGYSFTLDRLLGNQEPNQAGQRLNRAARNTDSTYQ